MRINDRCFASNDSYTGDIQTILGAHSFDLELFRELFISIREDYGIIDMYSINIITNSDSVVDPNHFRGRLDKKIPLTPYVNWEKLKSYIQGGTAQRILRLYQNDISAFEIVQKFNGLSSSEIGIINNEILGKNKIFERSSPGHRILFNNRPCSIDDKDGSIYLSVYYNKW